MAAVSQRGSPGPPKGDRLPVVEYLRGIAALSVAWFHLSNSYDGGWVAASGSLGWLGVDVFFVISGFVIPLSISRGFQGYSVRRLPEFLARRLIRLEPPYVVSIALTLVLWYLSSLAPGFQGHAPDWSVPQLLAHFLYLIPLTDFNWLQPVYWSLAWEFAFYVTMGLTFTVVASAKWRHAWVLAALTTMSLVLLGVVREQALLFVVGIAVFRLKEVDRPAGVMIDLIIAVLAIAAIATCSPKVAVVGLATALAIYASGSSTAPYGVHRALTSLGTVSYSLYLTHVPIGGRVVNLGSRFVDQPFHELLLSLFALAVSLGFAAVFWRFIERPFVAMSRRFNGARREG
jgi:peptidoglycan/LPS O-acetylase OafA/YrhL